MKKVKELQFIQELEAVRTVALTIRKKWSH